MVDLIPLLESPQDPDGVFHARSVDEDRLETSFEGGVLLDMLAVFVEGGGPDHAQFAAGEHRFEHVGGIHGAFGRAGTDDGVHLVDERDDLTL